MLLLARCWILLKGGVREAFGVQEAAFERHYCAFERLVSPFVVCGGAVALLAVWSASGACVVVKKTWRSMFYVVVRS